MSGNPDGRPNGLANVRKEFRTWLATELVKRKEGGEIGVTDAAFTRFKNFLMTTSDEKMFLEMFKVMMADGSPVRPSSKPQPPPIAIANAGMDATIFGAVEDMEREAESYEREQRGDAEPPATASEGTEGVQERPGSVQSDDPGPAQA